MALRMKELMEKTGESKSTLLYYIKEGLLPEPQKPKPNLHLYDEKSVKIVRLIKYLQEHLSYSISQIKEIFALNNFNFDDDFELIINSLKIISNEQTKEINEIYKEIDDMQLNKTLIKEYEETAKELAKLEFEVGKELLNKHPNSHEKVYKLLFDVILTLKPYIFNQATIAEHKNRFKENS